MIKLVEKLNTNKLRIEQYGFSRLININIVLYKEKVKGKKKIIVVLYKHDKQSVVKEEFTGISLVSLLSMLHDKRDLFRCHKGYIINPKMIERLNYANNTITLKYSDEEIPIGKTYKKDINLIL